MGVKPSYVGKTCNYEVCSFCYDWKIEEETWGVKRIYKDSVGLVPGGYTCGNKYLWGLGQKLVVIVDEMTLLSTW